jgi:hypothetical protein
MRIETRTPLKSLNPAYRKEKVSRKAIDRLKQELPLFLDRTRGKISESTLRDHLQTLLRGVAFPAEDFLVQSEVRRMDTVIHDGPKRKDAIGVIIEAKTTENSNEMFSTGKPNVKSLHELVLYFLRERHSGNTAIKNLLITNGVRGKTLSFPCWSQTPTPSKRLIDTVLKLLDFPAEMLVQHRLKINQGSCKYICHDNNRVVRKSFPRNGNNCLRWLCFGYVDN